MVITERQEMILSYLVGLAPIGQAFGCERRHAVSDLGINAPGVFNHAVNRLVDVGAVFIERRGIRGVPTQMRVMKRPEAFAVVTGWMAA